MASYTSLRKTGLIFAVSSLVSACSGLSLYNNFAPRDRGTGKVTRHIPFGPDARHMLDVYQPQNIRKQPVIMFIYGGSWKNGRRQDYGFIASVFAAQGYVTVVPDYRLVPQAHFPDFVEDGAAAIAWVHENAHHYGADGRQIILIGHSAGAYNAAMLSLDPSFLKQRGIDNRIIRAFVGLAGPYDFYPFDSSASRDAFGKYAHPQATQPITFARADAPPALLLTGSADNTVRPRNTYSLEKQLKQKGAVVETRSYDKLGHAGILLALTRSFRHRAPVLEDIIRFLENPAP